MERLTAFEFIPASRELMQVVRIGRNDALLLEVRFVGWCAIEFPTMLPMFDSRSDLRVEGVGIGHPYWNGETPPWHFMDAESQRQRVNIIRAEAERQVSAVALAERSQVASEQEQRRIVLVS